MISKRAKNISPSATLAITAKAKELQAAGVDVVSFAAGEPDFDTPQNINKAAKKAVDQGFTKYTVSSGILELKQAICQKLKKDNGLDYQPANILVGNGAKQCLFNIFQVIINQGDEVIIPVPYWVSYEEMVKLADGKCIFVKTKDFLLEPVDLLKAITSKTRALILNSPSNPTGTVYDRPRLKKIAKICVENNILVISDEIYEKLTYEGQNYSIAGLNNDIKKLTITVNGVSKSYSMTGWRIGYCAAEEEIIRAMSNLQDHQTSNPCSIAQYAALEAIGGDQSTVELMRAEFRKRRDLMVGLLNGIPDIKADKPAGAFYVFADISELIGEKFPGSADFCQKLLGDAHVACIPGSAFGMDSFIRLSFATSEGNIIKGLERIRDFLI